MCLALREICYVLFSICIRLAEVLKQQNKIDGAIAAYAEAIEINPDLSAGVYKIYADLLVQKNDTANDALLAYRKAAEIKHDWHTDFYVKLASLLMDNKKLDKAIKYFQKAIGLKSDNPTLYFSLCNAYHQQGKIGEAVRNYQKAIALKSD